MAALEVCRHLGGRPAGTDPEPLSDDGCAQCRLIGAGWNSLRLCVSCGNIGCCDDSPHRHSREHFAITGHPVIRSHEPGEDWLWCYPDDTGSADSWPG